MAKLRLITALSYLHSVLQDLTFLLSKDNVLETVNKLERETLDVDTGSMYYINAPNTTLLVVTVFLTVNIGLVYSI